MPKSLKIEELRELINQGEASDPLVFLESLMNGQDPRKGFSELYEFANDIHDFHEGPPNMDDWIELLELIKRHCKYNLVSLNESHSAAKTLAEYLHPKRKHVEKSESDSDYKKLPPLSKTEIKAFLKIYESEF